MIARNMTLGVLAGSAVMFAVAVGCGERSSTPAPEPTAALPASSGEQTDEAKTEAEPAPTEIEPAPAVAEPAPEPEPEGPALGEAEVGESGGLGVRRLVVAAGVEGREPIGAATAFEGGQRLYAFVEAANETEEDRQLFVTFEGPEGRSVGHVALDIPADSPRWRTWAYSRMVDQPGLWEAVVQTDEGEVVGRIAFQIDG